MSGSEEPALPPPSEQDDGDTYRGYTEMFKVQVKRELPRDGASSVFVVHLMDTADHRLLAQRAYLYKSGTRLEMEVERTVDDNGESVCHAQPPPSPLAHPYRARRNYSSEALSGACRAA
jgi:hypothetical protein